MQGKAKWSELTAYRSIRILYRLQAFAGLYPLSV